MMKWGLWKYGLQKGHVRDWDLELLWLITGYKFDQQVSLAFFSSFLLFIGCEPKMWWSKHVVSSMWTRALFQVVMLMAMENLVIIQHQYKLWYVTIWEGGYWPKSIDLNQGIMFITNRKNIFGD